MTVLNDEARKALSADRVAHMVTLNPDGSPQTSVVWVGLDGDQIVSAHLSMYRKLRNIERDPRIVLSLETGGRDAHGLTEYLVIEGTAEVTEGGGLELVNRLAQVYLGEGTVWPPPDGQGPEGYVLRITPEKVGGNGPWT
jgi:PPOX class probable F420-dependent enzyme